MKWTPGTRFLLPNLGWSAPKRRPRSARVGALNERGRPCLRRARSASLLAHKGERGLPRLPRPPLFSERGAFGRGLFSDPSSDRGAHMNGEFERAELRLECARRAATPTA